MKGRTFLRPGSILSTATIYFLITYSYWYSTTKWRWYNQKWQYYFSKKHTRSKQYPSTENQNTHECCSETIYEWRLAYSICKLYDYAVFNREKNSNCEYFDYQLRIEITEWWRVCIVGNYVYHIMYIAICIRQTTVSAIISSQILSSQKWDIENAKLDLDEEIELMIDIGMVTIAFYSLHLANACNLF